MPEQGAGALAPGAVEAARVLSGFFVVAHRTLWRARAGLVCVVIGCAGCGWVEAIATLILGRDWAAGRCECRML